MIYWDQVLVIFFLINLCVIIWIVSGYYYYKNVYIPKLETAEPNFAEGLSELFEEFSKGIQDSVSNIKMDFDLSEVSNKVTEQFFGTFMAILGVGEDYDPDKWTFQNYIKEIIDSSVEKIVPDTVKQFEEILPQFADQFITGIQEALTGAVSGMPDSPADAPAPAMGSGVIPNMDIGKMAQMMILQYIAKQMGSMGGFGNLIGGLGGSGNPTPGPSSGF